MAMQTLVLVCQHHSSNIPVYIDSSLTSSVRAVKKAGKMKHNVTFQITGSSFSI